MGLLKNEYKSFLDDIEKNVKNKEDLEYVKERFASFLDVVLDQMDYIMNYKEEEMAKLEEKQKDIDNQMTKMQQVLNNIEKDIYAEDGFDFEIICPYCNYQFIIDLDENKTEVKCPECNNIIELDWTGDIDDDNQQTCSGSCSTCNGCEDDSKDDSEDDM